MKKHALLSASGASRWLNCTPSPRIEEKFEKPDSSDYAAEGTLAHEFAEIGLKKALKQITPHRANKQLAALRTNEFYTDEMEGEVQKYVDYCMEEYGAVKGASIVIEEKIDLSSFIKEGFGTGDCIIIADDTMEVIDLKYGKGIPVSAKDNDQLKLYGLGAFEAYSLMYDITEVKLTVVQPRLNIIESWSISTSDLVDWGEKIVKPKAELAYKGEGLQQAGEWCKWCLAKSRCATLASKATKVARHEFKDPHLLTDKQLMDVYKQNPMILDWINAVAEYVLNEALKGKDWPGYKLVEGRSNRKWVDEERVMDTLVDQGFEAHEYLKFKLSGIGEIEKLVGKEGFEQLFKDLVIKPQGKPTLVPESDKRPAMGVEQAKKDFKDE